MTAVEPPPIFCHCTLDLSGPSTHGPAVMMPRQQAGHMIAIDPPVRILNSALEPKGPSTQDSKGFPVACIWCLRLMHQSGPASSYVAAGDAPSLARITV
jgi:hypothetical protein